MKIHPAHNHCDNCGELTINREDEYGEFVCDNCLQNRAEAAYERYCEAFHDGGADNFVTLAQRQESARRFK